MGLIDKIVDKTNELTEKAEKTYNEAMTPEYREKISSGLDKLDKEITKAVDTAAEKIEGFISGDKK